jgi:protein involved in polysaccharide export with SLBB domain
VEIKAQLEKEYYYQATVILAVDQLNKSRGKVYLVGQIRVAGPLDIPSDEEFTLSKAILRAGGFSDFADKKHVKVTRKGDTPNAENQILTVDVAEIFERGKTGKDVRLRVDDLIYVPARLVNL